MADDWKELTQLTQGQAFVVERVRLVERNIAIDGQFEPPALAKMTFDDQVFVAAFLRSHGSIREMEKYFGVSYPTIKGRLNRIAQQLDFVKIEPAAEPSSDVLARLERGEISAKDAIEQLNKEKEKRTP